MDSRQAKMLGGTLVVAGGGLLGISVFLKWWGLCIDVGPLDEVCASARGLEEWPGVVTLITALAVLVLGILGLTLRGQTLKALGVAASCVAAVGLLVAIISIVSQESIIGIEGTMLKLGPFVAGIAAIIALGGGIVLSRVPSTQATPERPPPPPVPTGGFTA